MDEGEVFYHFHGVVMDQNGRVWGGHFHREGTIMPDGKKLPGGNPVLATIDFTIIGHEGARIARKMDPLRNEDVNPRIGIDSYNEKMRNTLAL